MSKFDPFIDAARKPGKAPAKAVAKSDGHKKRIGAKRNDPDYKQALAYVRRDTHRRVMMRLAGEEREFSDLIETLLAEWLAS